VQAPKRRDGRRPRRPLPPLPRWAWLALAAAILAAIAAGVYGALGSSKPLPLKPVSVLGGLEAAPPAGPVGPEGVPIPNAKPLAPARGLSLGQTLDGISCQPIERLSYHIHIHLTIFVGGVARLIPYVIGIAPPRIGQHTPVGYFVTNGGCFAWLHTHANDGIIHVESPSPKTYTLGDFFDIWHQPLTANRIGPVRGHVTAFFNGRYYDANPRRIPLRKHAQIQLEIGTPLIAPESITFPSGL
jgi:hypothetical protein